MTKTQGVAMMNEKALSTFMAKIAEAQERLAELQNFVDDHLGVSPEDVSWGKAGDTGYIAEQLTNLTDWAFKRGEYAE
jgi:hypothetical protein